MTEDEIRTYLINRFGLTLKRKDLCLIMKISKSKIDKLIANKRFDLVPQPNVHGNFGINEVIKYL